ncbi:MAG: hypothetical protein LBN95_10260 [Prevotellaceae bacterium]|jgi:hypothetical protein|nr:hypothetical protein [Prevotellaceae bacterium]
MKNFKLFSAIAMIAICGFATSCKTPNPPQPDPEPPLVATWNSTGQDDVQLKTTSPLDALLQSYKGSILNYVSLPESFTFKKDGTGTYTITGAATTTGNFTYTNTETTITITAESLQLGSYDLSNIPFTVDYTLTSENSILKVEYDATAAVKASFALFPVLSGFIEADEITSVKLSAVYDK